MRKKPTQETYHEFQKAYDFFNHELFDNQLPDCLITYQRQAKTKGYFADGRFKNTQDGKIIDEIALNPDYFQGENITPKIILSTLAHEMCHLWQKYYGKPGRSRYHNQEWADKMLSIGLHPTHDGTITGRMTGDKVTHVILKGEKFDQAYEKLQKKVKILWVDRWKDYQSHQETKSKNKVKYVCPVCKLNVWGKPELQIRCGTCNCKLEQEQT